MDIGFLGELRAGQANAFTRGLERGGVKRVKHMPCITAHVQHRKVQLCSISTGARASYFPRMGKSADQEIAKSRAKRSIYLWREAMKQKTGWRAESWARQAGVSPTSITRTMDADYKSTSKIETLHSLAQAAGVTSVVEFLEAQTEGRDLLVPTVEQLEVMLGNAIAEMPAGTSNADFPQAVAASLHEQIRLFRAAGPRQDHPEGD